MSRLFKEKKFISIHGSIFVKVSEVEFNQDFIARVIPKIDWDCLCRAAEQLGHLEDLPKVDNSHRLLITDHNMKVTPENYEGDLDFLRKAHHALLEVCGRGGVKIYFRNIKFLCLD